MATMGRSHVRRGRDLTPPLLARVWSARVFLGLTVTWLAMLVMVPFAMAHEIGGRPATALSAGSYLVGGLICHQRPARSFRLWGVQMPVCGRCAGLYGGAALGAVVAGAWASGRSQASSPALHRGPEGATLGRSSTRREEGTYRQYLTDERRRSAGLNADRMQRDPHRRLLGADRAEVLRWVVVGAAVPTGVSVVMEALGIVEGSAVIRAVGAIPLGAAVTWVVSLVIRGELA